MNILQLSHQTVHSHLINTFAIATSHQANVYAIAEAPCERALSKKVKVEQHKAAVETTQNH